MLSHGSQRKTYQTPKLMVYGSVQALTAGGTGKIMENGMIGGAMNCYNGMTLGGNAQKKHCV